jgi:hypothetical protein
MKCKYVCLRHAKNSTCVLASPQTTLENERMFAHFPSSFPVISKKKKKKKTHTDTGGNVPCALFLAARAALLDTVLPGVTVTPALEKGEPDVSVSDDAADAVRINCKRVPLCVTVCAIPPPKSREQLEAEGRGKGGVFDTPGGFM